MATEVGKLVISLEARVERLERGLRRGGRAVDRFERRATRSFQSVGRRFARLVRRFSGLGVAIGGLAGAFGFAQFTRASIQAASDVETFRIRLRSLIGSTDEANASLERLTRTAQKVAPPLREIIEGAATLGTVALGSAAKIEQLTAQALNIQAVTGLTLIQTAQNLQRALSAGLGAADLFRERGIKALLEGLTDFSNLVEAPLSDVSKAIEEVFGPEGVFGQAAEQFADTLPGAISRTGDALFNLRAAFGSAISPAVVAFLTEQLIPFFESLQRSVERNEDAIRTFAERGLVALARGFIFATNAIANIVLFFSRLRVTGPRAIANVIDGIRKLVFVLAFVGPGVLKLLGIGAIAAGVPARLDKAAASLRAFADAGVDGLKNTEEAVNVLRGELLILEGNLDVFGAASSKRAEQAAAAFKELSKELQNLLLTARLIDDPRQIQARLQAQRQLNNLIRQGVQGRERQGDPLEREVEAIRARRQAIAETAQGLREQVNVLDDAIAAQERLLAITKESGGDVEAETRRLAFLTRSRELQAAAIERSLLPAQREAFRLADDERAALDRIANARNLITDRTNQALTLLSQLTGLQREEGKEIFKNLILELEKEASLERQRDLIGEAIKKLMELGTETATLAELGDTIGGVIGSGIKDALLTAIRGGSVDFGMILADTAARLLEKSIDMVLTDLATGLNDIIKGLGGSAGLGGAISSALGFGALLLAGALQDTEVETSAADVASAVTSTQAVRGIVAGPTQVAVAEIGRTIQEAFVETNLILRRMLTVLVDSRTLLAGGVVAAAGATGGGGAGFGADTDEILSTVSASFV